MIVSGGNQSNMVITSPQIRKIASLINTSKNDLIGELELYYYKFVDKFLENDLVDYYCYKDFIFVHGGMNPNIAPEVHSTDTLHWDRSLVRKILKHIGYAKSPGLIRRHGMEEQKEPEFVIDWEKTIVTGHNGGVTGGAPIIADRYMMLDAGAPKRLLVAELNSMEAFMAYPDKDRLVKYPLNETTREALMNLE